MNRNKKLLFLLIMIGCLLWIPDAAGQSGRDVEDQAERAADAAEVLRQITGIPEEGIPEELLEKAEAIAVFPHVVKGAFVVGGSWGKGLISQRNNGRWSPPVFLNLTGGSLGFQIGAQAADIVLVFTDKDGVDSILSSKLKLGADAAATVGPVGRTASAGTDVMFESGIYSYSRSKGLFAGIALDGAVLTVDDSANDKIYGRDASLKGILAGRTRVTSPVVEPFMQALNRYVGTPSRMARADIPDITQEQRERALKAADVMHTFAAMDETGIPRELLDRAYGIAVVPNVVRAAFGIGGRWGKGLLTVRRNGQWQPPVYIDLAGGSFGLQIGAQSTDLVLVFMDATGVRSILDSKLTLGADVSVAAGPVGRSAAARTPVTFDSAVYSYSRSEGIFAGVALDGVVITLDDSANRAVYGPDLSGERILMGGGIVTPPATMPFLAAVRQYAR